MIIKIVFMMMLIRNTITTVIYHVDWVIKVRKNKINKLVNIIHATDTHTQTHTYTHSLSLSLYIYIYIS